MKMIVAILLIFVIFLGHHFGFPHFEFLQVIFVMDRLQFLFVVFVSFLERCRGSSFTFGWNIAQILKADVI